MDEKTIVEKFHEDRVGLRFYENPVRIYVWEYTPFADPIPDPPVYEYVLHYGDHGETSTEQFSTKEEACKAAWKQAIMYLKETLELFE